MSKSEIKSPEQILREKLGYATFPDETWEQFKIRHSDWIEKVLDGYNELNKQAVKVSLEEAANKSRLNFYRADNGQSECTKVIFSSQGDNKVTVSKQSILSLEQSILNKLGV